jgi:hypothetical protein
MSSMAPHLSLSSTRLSSLPNSKSSADPTHLRSTSPSVPAPPSSFKNSNVCARATAFFSPSMSLCLFIGRQRVPFWVSRAEFRARMRVGAFNQLPSKSKIDRLWLAIPGRINVTYLSLNSLLRRHTRSSINESTTCLDAVPIPSNSSGLGHSKIFCDHATVRAVSIWNWPSYSFLTLAFNLFARSWNWWETWT